MRVTVCELPHEAGTLATAWTALREHVAKHHSELVLLPEFAFVEPLWERDFFDAARWDEGVGRSNAWAERLSELGVAHVVGTRPATVGRRHFNEGFIWSNGPGLVPLRSKWFLPDEPGGWEARWFVRGHREFPRFTASRMSFGLNICTELWALETYAAYADMGLHAVLCPRATCADTLSKWRSAGTVAAVRSGAYCLSSNRVHADGSCAGGGWIIGPDGDLLATTTPASPFCTIELDLGAVKASSQTYPRYVFARP
jgi:N-carbamoylputrescine amidase